MSNEEIMHKAAIEVFGEEYVNLCIEDGIDIPLHTRTEWFRRGFTVKENEEPVKVVKLWIHKGNNFYTTQTYLFELEQVEKL